MRKFWSFFTISLSNALVYRATGFIWMLNDLGPAVASLIFWLAAFNFKPSIAGYSVFSMAIYYLGVMIIDNLVDTHPQYNLAEEIRTGEFANYLLKPLSLTVKKIADGLSWRIARIIFVIPLLIIVTVFLKTYWVNLHFNLINLIAVIFSLIMAFFLNFFIKMTLGLSTIWFIEAGWLFTFYDIISSFFSGELIPLDMFPSSLFHLTNYFPFKYILFFPLSLGLNRITNIQQISFGLLIQLFWCFVFYLIYKLTLKRGIKKYDSYGG